MLNSTYLNCNEPILFQTVIKDKRNPARALLGAMFPTILDCYQQYLENFPTLEVKLLSEFNGPPHAANAEALKSCYEIATTVFEYIRGRIFSSQEGPLRALCPYCMLDRPKTLDHYVGMSEFPEYAILCRNLIPCCWSCNHKKNENWRLHHQRRYIHFYNDQFLHYRFLSAEMICTAGETVARIVYSLHQPDGMPDEAFRIVSTHFQDLELLREYSLRAVDYVSSERDMLDLHLQKPRGEVRQNLLDRHASLANTYGRNYWLAVFYEAMAGDVRLLSVFPE
jgi:hypothetical protein